MISLLGNPFWLIGVDAPIVKNIFKKNSKKIEK
jgi:hypothetical protein